MNFLINNFKWCLVIIGGFVLVIAFLSGGRYLGKASVEVVRIPDGARMPRAVIDESGTMHVIYFEGVMSGGDLFYVSRGRGHDTWSAPMLVNSEPRSVVGMGPIDGGQLAIDSRNVIHVVWFQTNPTRIFYTRSQQNTDLFEIIEISHYLQQFLQSDIHSNATFEEVKTIFEALSKANASTA